MRCAGNMHSSYYKWNMAIICNPPIMLCAIIPCPHKNLNQIECNIIIRAAVTIQRKYREWKGLPTPRTQIPPPPSPVTEVKLPVKAPIAIPAETDKLDYDTYMKNRRPGSVQLSEACSARPLLVRLYYKCGT